MSFKPHALSGHFRGALQKTALFSTAEEAIREGLRWEATQQFDTIGLFELKVIRLKDDETGEWRDAQ